MDMRQRWSIAAILFLFAVEAAWRIGVGSGSGLLLVSALPALWLVLAVRWRRRSLVAVGAVLVAIGSVLLLIVGNLVAWAAVVVAFRATRASEGGQEEPQGPPRPAVLGAGLLSALVVAGGVRCPPEYNAFYNDQCGATAPASVDFPLPGGWRIVEGPDQSCGSGGCFHTVYVVAAPNDVAEAGSALERFLTTWRNSSATSLQFEVQTPDEEMIRELGPSEALVSFHYDDYGTGWDKPVFDLPWND